MSQKLADLIFPETTFSIEELEAKYPPRKLPEGAWVTRVAPSPTGPMHLGTLYMSLICETFALQSNGVFFLRIEDTDREREVPGSREEIIRSLARFGIVPSEGSLPQNGELGDYGPYTQTAREAIYKIYVKKLIEEGRAYPCFATHDELEALHKDQEEKKVQPGYYGAWAPWRDRHEAEVVAKIEAGEKYVIRFRADEKTDETFVHHDLVKGDVSMPKNFIDFVLLKSDGIPTYHLAHAVDDHLMRVTHVVRGDEWLSSVPVHYALFQSLGFDIPKYAHIAPIMKLADGGRRKLSKRKDPEANVIFYEKEGYPHEAVLEYLLNIADSRFEDWRKANPTEARTAFTLDISRFEKSGALLDTDKMKDVAKNYIAGLSGEDVYVAAKSWADDNDAELTGLLGTHEMYAKRIFGIERGGEKPRKDLALFSEVREKFGYFFDELFTLPDWNAFESVFSRDEISVILPKAYTIFTDATDKDDWFEKLKVLGTEYSLATGTKEFKTSPDSFRGQVGDLAKVLRYALTGRTQTPDLYEMMSVMGKERVEKRLSDR